MNNVITEIVNSKNVSYTKILKGLKTYKFNTAAERDCVIERLKLEEIDYIVNDKKNFITIDSNFFVDENYDIKSFDLKDVNESLISLRKQEKIIFNDTTEKYSPFPTNHTVVNVNSTKKGILFFEHKDETFYIDNDDEIKVLKNDVIVVKFKDHNFKIVNIIDRSKVKLICEIKNENDDLSLVPLNVQPNFPISFNKNLLKKYTVGDRVLVNVEETLHDGKYHVSINNLICNKLDINSNYKTLSAAFGFRYDFSEETLNEINQIEPSIKKTDINERIDLRHKNIFTIDPASAMDLDDAISIEKTDNGYILQVHIAHISHYVKLDSSIFKDALQNTTSLYFPGSVNPMFPHKISSEICSLLPGKDRLCRTFEIHFDNTGKKVDYRSYKSIINSKIKMSFEDINEYAETGNAKEEYQPFLKDIDNMFTLSDKLTSHKLTRGYIGLENDELCFKLDEDNFPIAVSSTKEGKAQELIENFMLETNEAVSIMAGTLPFPYRNHWFPDETKLYNTINDLKDIEIKVCQNIKHKPNQVIQEILNAVKDQENFLVISRLILFSLQRANYSTLNQGHFGLALESYTHSTAPIRRIVDFMVHSLLDIYESEQIETIDLEKIEATLEEICLRASEKEREADMLEYHVDKLEMAKYMSKRIGEQYEMFIQDIKSDYVLVRAKGLNEGIIKLEDFYVLVEKAKNRKMLYTKGKGRFTIGNKLIVSVKDVDIDNCIVYYKALNKIEHQKERVKK